MSGSAGSVSGQDCSLAASTCSVRDRQQAKLVATIPYEYRIKVNIKMWFKQA